MDNGNGKGITYSLIISLTILFLSLGGVILKAGKDQGITETKVEQNTQEIEKKIDKDVVEIMFEVVDEKLDKLLLREGK